MSAHLVLIVGVVQIVFGTGQALLLPRPLGRRWVASEWPRKIAATKMTQTGSLVEKVLV